ncbi:zinc finger protein 646 [Alligator mississippiensis]|uniref:zinc finger protein 646 n=1 Tax=Alligator mississippiensis TaxID=8496 RepID=UPI002877B39D|nr:zinc finger protein 646 [Alligator mississippiensis]
MEAPGPAPRDERRYRCRQCPRAYRHAGSLANHRRTHELGVFPCRRCPKEFSNPMALKNHLRLHTDGPSRRRHPCPDCGRVFRAATQLSAHCRAAHPGHEGSGDPRGGDETHQAGCQPAQDGCRAGRDPFQKGQDGCRPGPGGCQQIQDGGQLTREGFGCLQNGGRRGRDGCPPIHDGGLRDQDGCPPSPDGFPSSLDGCQGGQDGHQVGPAAAAAAATFFPPLPGGAGTLLSNLEQYLAESVVPADFSQLGPAPKMAAGAEPVERRYRCDQCGKAYKHAGSLTNHRQSHTLGVYPCAVCFKEFANLMAVKNHARLHAGHRPHSFPLAIEPPRERPQRAASLPSRCPPSDECVKAEKHPEVAGETEARPYCCGDCGRTYRHAGSLVNHRQSHQTGIYACGVCAKRLYNMAALKNHLRVHLKGEAGSEADSDPVATSPRPYRCGECGRTYRHRGSLVNHRHTHRTGVYRCSLCPKEYSNLMALRTHVRVHGRRHGEGEEEQEEKTRRCPPGTSAAQPHICGACGDIFGSLGELRSHARSHGGPEGRAFACEVCGRRYRHAASLVNHRRCHQTGDFACPLCAKALANMAALKSHLRGHQRRSRRAAPGTDGTVNEVTVQDVSGNEATPGDISEVTLEDVSTDEAAPGDVSVDEVTLEDVSADEVAPGNVSVDEVTLGDNISADEVTPGDVPVDEVPLGEDVSATEVAPGGTPSEVTQGGIPLGDVSVDRVALGDVSIDDITSGNVSDAHYSNAVNGWPCPKEEDVEDDDEGGGASSPTERPPLAPGIYQCSLCPKEFPDLPALRCHFGAHGRARPATERPYLCSLCGLIFPGEDDLRTHHGLAHEAPAPASPAYPEPDGRGEDESPLLSHICGYCGQTFDDMGSLEEHSAGHREEKEAALADTSRALPPVPPGVEPRPYSCGQCGKTYRHGGSLVNHRKTHQVGHFPCSVCTRHYPNLSAYRNHLRNHPRCKAGQPSPVPLRPGKAGQTSAGHRRPSREDRRTPEVPIGPLNWHNEAKTKLEAPDQPPGSDHRPPQEDTKRPLDGHPSGNSWPRQEGEKKPDACDGPPSGHHWPLQEEAKRPPETQDEPPTGTHWPLQEEAKWAHDGPPSDTCWPPQEEVKSEMGDGSPASCPRVEEGGAERPFRCELCGRSYRHAGSLINHRQTHKTGLFRCGVCHKAFYNLMALKNHHRIHFEARRHRCQHCPKAFRLRKQLLSHQRGHRKPTPTRRAPGGPRRLPPDPEARPYGCEECGRTYRHAGSLLNHRRSHATGHYACGACPRTYANLLALKNHERVHSRAFKGRRHPPAHARRRPRAGSGHLGGSLDGLVGGDHLGSPPGNHVALDEGGGHFGQPVGDPGTAAATSEVPRATARTALVAAILATTSEGLRTIMWVATILQAPQQTMWGGLQRTVLAVGFLGLPLATMSVAPQPAKWVAILGLLPAPGVASLQVTTLMAALLELPSGPQRVIWVALAILEHLQTTRSAAPILETPPEAILRPQHLSPVPSSAPSAPSASPRGRP